MDPLRAYAPKTGICDSAPIVPLKGDLTQFRPQLPESRHPLPAASLNEKTVRVLADPVECSKYLGIAGGSAFGKSCHEEERC